MMILPIGLLEFQVLLELLLLLFFVKLVIESRFEILLICILIKHQILISVIFRILLVAKEWVYCLHLVNNQKFKF